MKTIYLDNAATSWPKPAPVSAALSDYLGDAGGNPGRSGHRMSVAAARIVESARESLAELFNVSDPSGIVFTYNATHALNLALYGLLQAGDHVVTTSMEHNSVMRPLRHLEGRGVELTLVPAAPDGTVDVPGIQRAIRPSSTRLLVTTHASNVVGTLSPVAELAAIAHAQGIVYLLDAAQTAGAVPIDVQTMQVDLLAFTGHKALLGPTGTGGLYIREGIEIAPLMRGGTGSDSAHEIQPQFLPDAHESGTLNLAGIAGLDAGVRFLSELGIQTVRAHEQKLVRHFLSASDIPGVKLYGPGDASRQCGVVSFNIARAVPSEVGLLLDQSFGIMARTGLHCAPSAHRTLGTFPAGTVRFSFGWFNTPAEVDTALKALKEIAAWAAKGAMVPGTSG